MSIDKRNIFIIPEPLQRLHLCGYISPALITYPSILIYKVFPPPAHGKMTGKDLWNRNKPSGFDREKGTVYAALQKQKALPKLIFNPNSSLTVTVAFCDWLVT